jgi:hypothetical protein
MHFCTNKLSSSLKLSNLLLPISETNMSPECISLFKFVLLVAKFIPPFQYHV